MSLLWISAEQCVEKVLTSGPTIFNKKAQWTIEYMALVVGINQSTLQEITFCLTTGGNLEVMLYLNHDALGP